MGQMPFAKKAGGGEQSQLERQIHDLQVGAVAKASIVSRSGRSGNTTFGTLLLLYLVIWMHAWTITLCIKTAARPTTRSSKSGL